MRQREDSGGEKRSEGGKVKRWKGGRVKRWKGAKDGAARGSSGVSPDLGCSFHFFFYHRGIEPQKHREKRVFFNNET